MNLNEALPGFIAESADLKDAPMPAGAALFNLVFEPAFSTADSVTNLSGRGVGMDVVKRNITALRGTVAINSAAGRGTTVTIRLPLTLAIINGFQVAVGKSNFVLPLDAVGTGEVALILDVPALVQHAVTRARDARPIQH